MQLIDVIRVARRRPSARMLRAPMPPPIPPSVAPAGRAARLRQWARALKRDGLTLWFALRHPATPWWAKALAWGVVAYALSPIDLIPDFIPVLGYVDELLLLPGLIWLTLRCLPPAVRDDCRAQAEAWLAAARGRPRSRWGAVLVVAVWLALLAAGAAWWFGRGSG